VEIVHPLPHPSVGLRFARRFPPVFIPALSLISPACRAHSFCRILSPHYRDLVFPLRGASSLNFHSAAQRRRKNWPIPVKISSSGGPHLQSHYPRSSDHHHPLLSFGLSPSVIGLLPTTTPSSVFGPSSPSLPVLRSIA